MQRFPFRLADLGEGIAEVEIAAWYVAPGDIVTEDQLLVEVMTDKATVEITSPVAGKILVTNGEVGSMLAIGSTLMEFDIEAPYAVVEATLSPPPVPPPRPQHQPDPDSTPPAAAAHQSPLCPSPPMSGRAAGEKPLASPATRRRALEQGVKLQFVPGTGPAGRITSDDLDAYMASGDPTPHVRPGGSGLAERHGVEEHKVVGLRRKIAEKMQEAKRHIPHFSYIEEIDVTDLEDLRQYLNATKQPDRPKLTLLPFLVRALVRVLPEFPQINATFDDAAGIVHRHAAVHLGMATQTRNGLTVPVIRHAEARDIWALATEIGRLATAAREGNATREELSGSTITVTSLGPLGGLMHTPVINYPEVAIVGPNRIIERPVVRDGAVALRKIMNLSSSFDHRVVDGYDAAAFVQALKQLLERPATIFVD
jgi:2-oxoisovalerate dehydrogenase E2 component (dihydrolipoyl transacylase)